MKIKDIQNLLDAKVLCYEEGMDTEVNSACGSDMMSDVLAYVKDQAVLLTGLLKPQVIRTAEMMDMNCIVFVRGKEPDEDMIEVAIASVEAIFDWKAYLKETFGYEVDESWMRDSVEDEEP